ncbi:hypothetical protein SCP_0300290 [Sparassis crispa]|uniref:Uncharacterized protein n=1 Tax=Sparassis crispa TaxID=139825 RepID=A0A401GDQ2_9APHY|nr:hypothetical protein SCP_0300290 [Sparassis crispa]GBE80314.1 hypothetical protein SCP_0300290 [Sparassis crispa]
MDSPAGVPSNSPSNGDIDKGLLSVALSDVPAAGRTQAPITQTLLRRAYSASSSAPSPRPPMGAMFTPGSKNLTRDLPALSLLMHVAPLPRSRTCRLNSVQLAEAFNDGKSSLLLPAVQ